MNRLKYILFLLFMVGSLALASAQERPNILFILTDDLGYHDLSITGSEIYQTPNIDDIAEEGISFKKAYVNYPRCVPSRYAYMTGLYPVNEDKGNLKVNIPEERNFIKIFNEAGYNTSYVGKWHLGELPSNKGEGNDPKGFGFKHSYGAGGAGGVDTRFYPFNIKSKKKNSRKDPVPNVEEDGREGDYLSDMLTNATMGFIKENAEKDQPFLAMLAFYAVHTPLEAKVEDRDRNKKEIDAYDYGDTPEYIKEGEGRRKMRQDDPDYAGMVENVDENVGRLLELLEELDIDDNTIIVFTSDHGGLSNDGYKRERHLATTNNPLRAGKGHLYEGGIRVPLFIKWEDRTEERVEDKSVVMAMDVYPTLIDMVLDRKVSGTDGKSFKPVIEEKETWEDRIVFWHNRKARPHSTGDSKSSAVRSGDYKLIHFFEKDKVELYNLREDISEENNLAEKEPEKTKELMELLEAWKEKQLVEENLRRRWQKEDK
ncbi:sulfatase [Salegentibacter chungangensis]|uniref:Sulfatase n=1 Tax=Salegentibacter chungangensis TaxID=1335724 RepID=A0ABW3NP84_9FLAO